MDIGITLPTLLEGIDAPLLRDWIVASERSGFGTIGATDRPNYRTWEPFSVLAAAAALTERATLATVIALATTRGNELQFAKQMATIDQLSGGRLVVGLGAGSRQDDFDISGVDYHTRGAALSSLIDTCHAVWKGETGVVGPLPITEGGPPILLGGRAPAAIRRIGERADGWIGSSGPDAFTSTAAEVNSAWSVAGRSGDPKLWSIAYFSLGAGGREIANESLLSYYSFNPDRAGAVAASAATTPEDVRGLIDGMAAAGCGNLVFIPCNPDIGQVDLLAAAAGL
jgi:alkanesulfonate monooxygenase SsuD/methylene tetrahydromethanopterin reductase-like flavin-dependent oxidoreductase (luciferase family)